MTLTNNKDFSFHINIFTGVLKPLYFDLVRNDSRFFPYKDKIIYLFSSGKDIEYSVNIARKAIKTGDKKKAGTLNMMK